MTFLKLIRRKFCPHFLMGRGRFFLRFDLSEILASNVERQKERKNKQNEQTERESSQTQTIEIKIKHSKDGEEEGSVEKRKEKNIIEI